MRFLTPLFLLFVLAAAPAKAQPGPDAHAPAIWRVAQDDSTVDDSTVDGSTVYLFGTIHLLEPRTPWFSETLETILADADTLVLEVTPDSMAPMKMQALIQEVGFYPPGDRLADHMPEDVHTRLMAEAQKFGIPTPALNRMRPWMAALTLTARAAVEAGFLPEHGAEAVLAGKAEAAGAEIRGLETPEEQMSFFAAMSEDAQISWLREGLDQMADIDAFFQTMKGAWLKGDMDGLDALLTEGLEATPELADTLLYQRNKAWLPEITALLDEPGTHIVAVGAGHLTGKHSVLALLAGQGYAIERL